MFLVVSLLIAAVLQQPPASPPASSPARGRGTTPPATGTAARPPATGSATLNVRVTDRTGNPALEAQISAEGPSTRSGTTDVLGTLTLRTLQPGTYRIRAERMGFVALEKEVVVRAGTQATEFALTAAPPVVEPPKPTPPPAPAAPPPAAPAAAKLAAGDPKTLSISNLAEKSLDGRDPVKTVAIGCSGASKSQLLVVREAINTPSRDDVDEMIYLVAGEASLSMNGKDQGLTASWFTLIPRGTPYTITRKGRNPAVLLAISSGEPCK